MITITGKIEDTEGSPKHVLIVFASTSTPLVGAGVVTGNSHNSVRSNASDGTFSIDLKPGNYSVSYNDGTDTTRFNITLDPLDDGTTQAIEDVVSTPLDFVATPPNTVWNGVRAGHITFDPIAAPGVPVPTVVAYVGADVRVASENYRYVITYETQDGETEPSAIANVVATADADKAHRIPLAISPTRVTSKKIWRNITSALSEMWLLAEVGPAVAYYDDWESHTTFAGRASVQAPAYNTTAGIIRSDAVTDILYFSISGLRCLQPAQFDSAVKVKNNVRTYNGSHLMYAGVNDADADWMVELSPSGPAINVRTAYTLLIGKSRFTSGISISNAGEVAGYVLTCVPDGLDTGFAQWQPAPGGVVGTGSPEGVVTASPGTPYLDDATDNFWMKKTGTGNTGWTQLIGP